MPLENALTDRLRTHRKTANGGDEFADTYGDEYGPWVPCRVHTPSFRETRRDEAYDYQRELTAMVSVEASDGTKVELKKTDKIELDSEAFGNHEYAILGDPEPVRGLEEVIYWKVAIKRWDH